MRLIAAIWALVALAGCGAGSGGARDTCAPGAYDDFAGLPLDAITLPPGLDRRVLRPGQIATGELQPGRLTVILDGDGNVERSFCG